MNPFTLAYREQKQLFLFEKTYLWGTLFKVGGLATLLARFMVQFFWNPKVALVLTLFLLTLSAWMLWVFVRRSRKEWGIIPLCLIPACFLGASLSDNSLHFEFLTSILLVQVGLLIYKRIKSKRLLWGVLLTVILYFAAGSAAVLFSVCATLSDCLRSRQTPGIRSLLYIPVAAICGMMAYYTSAVPTWADAFTPAFYYDLDAALPTVHWISWIALIIVSLASCLPARKFIPVLSGFVFLGSLIFADRVAKNLDSKAPIASYEYEYYTVNEDWDGLIESCRHHEWTPLTANYLNMALAQKGVLAEDLLKYDQRGVMSLAYVPEDKTVDVRLAYIMYAMGNMAAAQDVSFNALTSLTGYNPSMLKMNARIELMRGAYGVADKYLSILEKTPHYRSWAKEQRRFLWNDDAVESDPELGTGRKDFPEEDGFAMFDSPVTELARIIEANPSDKKAMQYYLSFLLLAKDLEGLFGTVNSYWGAPALRELPVPVQEAMIFYSEYSRNFERVEPVSLEWCFYHGVTDDTARRFQAFQQASLQSQGTAPKGFRGTYWNYLIYTAI